MGGGFCWKAILCVFFPFTWRGSGLFRSQLRWLTGLAINLEGILDTEQEMIPTSDSH